MASRPSDFTLSRVLPRPNGVSRTAGPPAPAVSALRFALPHASNGSLTVVDADGRTVRTLLAPVVPAGEIHAAWDGLDDRGERVLRGSYCLRLEIDGHLLTSRRVEIR